MGSVDAGKFCDLRRRRGQRCWCVDGMLFSRQTVKSGVCLLDNVRPLDDGRAAFRWWCDVVSFVQNDITPLA